MFAILIGIIIAFYGIYVYSAMIFREYRTRTWSMSNIAASQIDTDEAIREAEFVVSTYDRMPEEEKAKLQDKKAPELAAFDGARGEGFDRLCEVLRQVQEDGGCIAAFTAFFDLKTNRRVFIADSDPDDSFCPPGSWDELDPETIQDLMNGKKHFIDGFFGGEAIPATIINMEAYGRRCMAGTRLCEINGYPVFVFFDTDMNQLIHTVRQFVLQFAVFLVLTTIVGIGLSMRRIGRTIAEPINELAEAANTYVSKNDDGRLAEKHFEKLDIHTGDEIESLATAMQKMEDDIAQYVRNLTHITAEKERIDTELSLAGRIQESMLPHQFPPFPDREEFEIYASMDPAKEVGGDFYDFHLIDDDHLGMVIADVSGKGVPGALFMMLSKIILQSCMMMGVSPAEILNRTNELICANNEEAMFVTVWIGILELSTGKLTAANAGHEYPALKRKTGPFTLFRDRHGFVIGGMKALKYKEYDLTLQSGDKLFVYTDGVPEAMNGEREQFGTERMLDALNNQAEATPEEILQNVGNAVDRFVGGAEQFDDLTMLCVEYKGPQEGQGTGAEEP